VHQASFISDPGATQEAVTAKLRELMAEYTPPPPPVLTEAPTPAPTTLATQFRAVQISATLSLAAVEDFTDALRAQFLADLQRLPGVESAQILATMQGSVIVKAAVIVSGEGAAGADAAVQSVTSALSNTSGVFASEMGATGAVRAAIMSHVLPGHTGSRRVLVCEDPSAGCVHFLNCVRCLYASAGGGRDQGRKQPGCCGSHRGRVQAGPGSQHGGV